ncbi:hypothetical protein Tsubulata_025135 [Turnera subulata]|uniref:Uncharacterized protein n=1 Tax=Turnera subulata TaxID=218843 RepID=A0A9Q0J524_9ROSI|nr:hypothetical protein Tsubulata_025135 [Turnera subulata]
MPKMNKVVMFYFFFSFFIATGSLLCSASGDVRKVYIVYMGSLSSQPEYSPTSHHLSMLQEALDDSGFDQDSVLIASYKRSFNGFAANLTNTEAQKLASMEGVVSVFPSRTLHLQTTRSWDFMGLDESAATQTPPGAASDVIIGVLDSGIWPESESFRDEGFGPPPKKWKGICSGGVGFKCNNKIIGARGYKSSGPNVRDTKGHGTHTASTAAGNRVKDISFYGLAKGTARGGLPSARVAAYKVCNHGCESSDVLLGFDDAIADGVDIITISLGGQGATNLVSDEIAIGSFHAMEKGILTVHSAGNTGPFSGTVTSVAPWLLSVAASSTDRQIIDKVVLGNGKTIIGSSVNTFTFNGRKFPLIRGADASTVCSEDSARMCEADCLNSTLVKGKIVLCERTGGVSASRDNGAVGTILLSRTPDNIPFIRSAPATSLTPNDYNLVQSYTAYTKNPTAEILSSDVIKDSAAPAVASFSSRGPNTVMPDIMKPDISAPGVDILAAFSPVAAPTSDPKDNRRVKYSISSGTSMACPHVAGAAAYIKAFHPDWSPSVIKSALMTTAWPMNASKNPDGEFAYGAGHMNPKKAIHPGLVYDAYREDYIKLLCSAGYGEQEISKLTRDNNISCPSGSEKKSRTTDFNYPSMTVKVEPRTAFQVGFHRTVTNVGPSGSTYKAKIMSNPRLRVKVEPRVLSFDSSNKKKSFRVTIAGRGLRDKTMVTASLVWSDGIHSVRSPIIAYA